MNAVFSEGIQFEFFVHTPEETINKISNIIAFRTIALANTELR